MATTKVKKVFDKTLYHWKDNTQQEKTFVNKTNVGTSSAFVTLNCSIYFGSANGDTFVEGLNRISRFQTFKR